MTAIDDSLEPLLGKKSADALADGLGLRTVGDLLRHYPRRYDERGKLTSIASLELDEHATVLADVSKVTRKPMRARRGTMTEVIVTDGTRPLSLVFFTQKIPNLNKLVPGKRGLFAGKVSKFNRTVQLAHPEFQLLDDEDGEQAIASFARKLIPVYPAVSGLPTWSIARCVEQVLQMWDGVVDPLPDDLIKGHNLLDLMSALKLIHLPDSQAAIDEARRRLKWDEALSIQLALAQRRRSAAARPATPSPRRTGGLLDAFDERLPFQLTNGQREIGEVLAEELGGTHPMNRLLQGEVGSGKTLVALRGMLQVVDAGRQAAMLAPTEVLAAQHARSLRDMLGDLATAGELGAPEQATRVVLLTGSMNTAQRRQAMLDIASGTAGIVVGTHALIQDKVSFAELGFVVVDEQHRFGVEQRDALRGKAGDGISPHVLVMTATPIPRTVAMTVYGDLEVSALRELPQGRSPIRSSVVPVAEKPAWLGRAWERIREEVAAGHQAYVVCPRIGDDEDAEPKGGSDQRPPLAVMDVLPKLAEGPLKGLRVDMLHGRMPPEDKDAVMRAFAANDVQVLVATTVIEVGVNVPNATVMVIMDADRFGVSQLHQLRGRVGRGSAAGLCLLVSEIPAGTSTMQRLQAVADTLDGFELAQMDLELRREGDILGAAQSGMKSGLKMLSLLDDLDVIEEARQEAQRVVGEDPDLAEHPGLAQMVREVVDAGRAEYLEKS
ncbi:ATP-dependent DNA helicase RecG [Kutzneria buriramensis]|uniref:ATP-dependent DNA helicase RecG n=1 Tax=Kutzneria buriramensis TaxID=1045776 RepID=A0A3E0HB10_9PSEU|nr:ATP-dependent DNA helicase RecG [Kutzneria buriramensis]REH41225.1 ATP-dependent DNA helicase RecG [Kutzneria buriramensis]